MFILRKDETLFTIINALNLLGGRVFSVIFLFFRTRQLTKKFFYSSALS